MEEQRALAELRLELRERAEALEGLFATAVALLDSKGAMNAKEVMIALAQTEEFSRSMNSHEGQLDCYRSVRSKLQTALSAR